MLQIASSRSPEVHRKAAGEDTAAERQPLPAFTMETLSRKYGRGAARRTIQRTIKVNKPADKPAHLDPTGKTADEMKTIPAELSGKTGGEGILVMLEQLCAGGWKLSGDEVKPANDEFCKPDKLSATATPTSCACICDAISSKDTYNLFLTDKAPASKGGPMESITQHGEGGTDLPNPGETKVDIYVSGRSHSSLQGFGDTSPQNAKPAKPMMPGAAVLRDPGWLILGHELCGHGLKHVEKYRTPAKWNKTFHELTQQGDQSAPDIENKIRAEHSTAKDNLGQRVDRFTAWDKVQISTVAGTDPDTQVYQGATYVLTAKETLDMALTRIGKTKKLIAPRFIKETYLKYMRKLPPTADNSVIVDGVFWITDKTDDMRGDYLLKSDIAGLKAGDTLLVEGITWHTCIKGDTLDALAKVYGKPVASLTRANPAIASASTALNLFDRVLIPET